MKPCETKQNEKTMTGKGQGLEKGKYCTLSKKKQQNNNTNKRSQTGRILSNEK